MIANDVSLHQICTKNFLIVTEFNKTYREALLRIQYERSDQII